MSKAWLDIFLGKIGKYIANFFVDYYVYLIPVILIYGIFLTLSSHNLKRIEKKLDLEIVNQARKIVQKNPDISYVNLVMGIKIPWDKLVEKNSFFPFISGESDIWVSRATPTNVRRIFMQDEENIKEILERNKILIPEQREDVRRNLYLNQIHKMSKRDK